MLSYDDVLELCELNEDEIAAISEHEGIPEICAAEYGYYLCHTADGVPKIRRFILDDIETAKRHGDMAKVVKLRAVLAHFVRMHPDQQSARAG